MGTLATTNQAPGSDSTKPSGEALQSPAAAMVGTPRWRDKVVLVTGGSAGLGLAIGRQFAIAGARTILLARDVVRLEQAVESLRKKRLRVDYVVCDVTSDDEVEASLRQLIKRFGRLDVLVNNAGRSVRLPLASATVKDYREFLEVNFLSAVRCTQAALPYVEETSGHVVNIGSLASKTGWPFLAPYSASKFALAAYTHQLRLEGPRNVHYMLVCPGPIKREDAGVRYDSEVAMLPDPARRPAAGARVEGIDADVLARKIIHGCQRRKREIVFPFRARILFAILAYSPPIGDWILKRFMRQ